MPCNAIADSSFTPQNLPSMPKYQFSCEVSPSYVPEQSAPERAIFGFSYTVTITNTGTMAAQLVSRHWVICDSAGRLEEVKGLGVLGHQPLIKPGESFQYTSGSRLATASGTMHGSYFCVAEDGERFEAVIPMFVLEAHSADGGSNSSASTRVLH